MAVRFSPTTGGRDSSETARDLRGFAVKFYTEDGNWDLVGSSLAVSFVRDPLRFPDVVHALKPDPVTCRPEPGRLFGLLAQLPESMQLVIDLFGPRGIPADYRHMQGFGVNTYRWVDPTGESCLVKYHFHPTCGVASLTAADAAEVQARDLGHASRDLYDAIERGDGPEWSVSVQVMDDEQHDELGFDPLDPTKVWPEDVFPLRPIGSLRLNRNVKNVFAETEQIAFGAGVLVDDVALSDDRVLVGRAFAYGDSQRYRLGVNYLHLPVNAPAQAAVRTHLRDGAMTTKVDGSGGDPRTTFEPSSDGGLRQVESPGYDDEAQGRLVSGLPVRVRLPKTNDYLQAGERYVRMEQWERDDLVGNLTSGPTGVPPDVQQRMVWHLSMCEDELGRRVADGLSVTLDQVRALDPLPGQELDPEERRRHANLGSNGPRENGNAPRTHCVPNSRAESGLSDPDARSGAQRESAGRSATQASALLTSLRNASLAKAAGLSPNWM